MEPQEQVSRHKIKKAIKLNKLCFDNKVWIKWYQFLTEWTNRNFVDDTLKVKNVKQCCINGEVMDHTESENLWYTDKLKAQSLWIPLSKFEEPAVMEGYEE